VFDVQAQRVGDTYVVTPAGELDLATAHALGRTLAQAAELGAEHVVLDLRELTFIDSSGISVIIKLQRHFAVEGVRFGVIKGDDIVQRAFALAHVEPLLPWITPPSANGSGPG
jgi:anti-sigma B factor antagonist